MQLQSAFTASHRDAIETLRKELARRVRRTVAIDYGATDDGREHDATFVVEELPEGALGRPGPLVSILTGPCIKGDGFVVMGADGATLAEGVSLNHAVQSARFAAVREYRKQAEGALAS
jgi:hypothetical protein